MDPIENGIRSTLCMPFYVVNTAWDVITSSDHDMLVRLSLAVYMIIIQYVLT